MTRFGYVMVTYSTVFGIGFASFVTMPVKLLWNATASTPVGLYSLGAPDTLKRGDFIAVRPDNRPRGGRPIALKIIPMPRSMWRNR